MIKVKTDEVNELLREMEEARGYIQLELRRNIKAASRRLMRIENKLRLLMGQRNRWTEAEIAEGEYK